MSFLTGRNKRPYRCPECYASDEMIVKSGRRYHCQSCGATWSESDEIFGQAMLPEDKTEGAIQTLLKLLRGNKDDDNN